MAEKDIKPDVDYEVKLKSSVKYGPTWLRPKDKVVVKGHVLSEIKDAVASYKEVK